MATLQQMLDLNNGDLQQAKQMAKNLIAQGQVAVNMDLALLYSMEGNLEDSLKHTLKCKDLPGYQNRVAYQVGYHVFKDGDLLQGLRMMNMGRFDDLWGNKHIGTDKPIWTLELFDEDSLNGKRLLFYCEAGLGDQIAFARFAPEFNRRFNAVVTMCCDKGLVSVFKRMPGIFDVLDYSELKNIEHDYWMPSMLAPVALDLEK